MNDKTERIDMAFTVFFIVMAFLMLASVVSIWFFVGLSGILEEIRYVVKNPTLINIAGIMITPTIFLMSLAAIYFATKDLLSARKK